MSYYERFELFSQSLLTHCKKLISENHQRFDSWLRFVAEHELGSGYQYICKEHFGNCITDEIKDKLFFAGKNILYAINSFIWLKGDEYELDELLEFVEKFICEQLDDFDNDYDTCGWFNNETEDIEEANNETDNIEEAKDDNPQ